MSLRTTAEHFFHAVGSSRSSALLRMGLVALCWTRFAKELLPYKHVHEPDWLVLGSLFYLSSLTLFVGFYTRASAVLLGAVLLSFRYYLGFATDHEPYVHHHVHVLIMGICFLVATPCGRSWSVDRWLALRRGVVSPERGRILGLHLMTVMLSVIYLFGTLTKLKWSFLSGERMQHSLQLLFVGSDPVTVPGWAALCLVMAWTAVVVEPAIALGIWLPRWRLRAVLVGCLFHLAIYWLLPVGTFSLTMMVCYLAVFPPDQVHRFLDRLAPAESLEDTG